MLTVERLRELLAPYEASCEVKVLVDGQPVSLKDGCLLLMGKPPVITLSAAVGRLYDVPIDHENPFLVTWAIRNEGKVMARWQRG